MKLDSYKGLCVGGPLAGHWVSEISDTMDADGFRYRYFRVGDFAEFWIPEERDETWAFMELIRGYRSTQLLPDTLHMLDQVQHHAYRTEALVDELLAVSMKKPVLRTFMGTGTMPIQPQAAAGVRGDG